MFVVFQMGNYDMGEKRAHISELIDLTKAFQFLFSHLRVYNQIVIELMKKNETTNASHCILV